MSPTCGTKRRSYAESTGQPWAILSAEHGLVDPDQTLEPYDRYLESEPASYQEQWSRVTADAVIQEHQRHGGIGSTFACGTGSTLEAIPHCG
jgi:hypothetical protein